MSEENEQLQDGTEELEPEFRIPWFVVAALSLTMFLAGFFVSHYTEHGGSVIAGEKITLSGSEREKAVSIAERRQRIQFDRQSSTNAYTAQMNRYQEQENDLNVEANKLCFELKKAHKFDPGTNWFLNEYKGELEKR